MPCRSPMRAVALLASLIAAIALAPGTASASGPPPREPFIVVGGSGDPDALNLPGFEQLETPLFLDRLRAAGYDVTFFPQPAVGLSDFRENARQLARVVDEVLARTGAEKVSLMGQSLGGFTMRQYIKFNGGGDKVRNAITTGTPNQGNAIGNLLMLLGPSLPIAFQQASIGSQFLADLNYPTDTVPPVRYVTVDTHYDEINMPFRNFQLHGPGAQNIDIQAECGPLMVTEHAIDSFGFGPIYSVVASTLRGDSPSRINCAFPYDPLPPA